MIETAAGHPFYVVGKGYVEATELQVGYELLLHDGEITSIMCTPVKTQNGKSLVMSSFQIVDD